MRKLLTLAAAVAALHSLPVAASDVVQRAEKAFAAQMDFLRKPVSEEEVPAAWIAPNAVYQFALNGIGISLRLEGRDAVAAHLRALAEATPSGTVEKVMFFPTLEPEVVFVQYDLILADGERSRPLASIQMRGEQIAKFSQFNRTPEILQALQATSAFDTLR